MKKQNIPNKGSEKKIRNEITEEQKKEIRDAYEPFKEKGINPNDLKLAMKALRMRKYQESYRTLTAKENLLIHSTHFLI